MTAFVLADTSPLRFLVEIGYEHMLVRLFNWVWIPGAVMRELRHDRTPRQVRDWATRIPSWVEVREIPDPDFDPEVSDIDRGEWEGIQLATEINADLLLIDDRAGVQIARRSGFNVNSTLGILVEAAGSGLIRIEDALEKLGETKFRR